MSDSVKDATRMLNAAQQTGKTLSIGFINHFHPAMKHIKECIETGRLGTILQIHWHVGSYITLVNSVSRHQADMPGALMMDYVHQPDLIHWWLGPQPGTVFAAGCCGGDVELTSNPNVLSIIVQYQTGTVATINLNYLQPSRAYCEIVGDRGDIRFDFGTEILSRTDYQADTVYEQPFPIERDRAVTAEHDCFINAVKAKTLPESPPEEAILATQLAEAAITSWQRKEAVSWTLVG